MREQKKKFSTLSKISIAFIWIFSLFIAILAATGIFRFFNSSYNANTLLQKYIAETPQLVFNKLSFYKYLVRGTSDNSNNHLDKLTILHATGSADFAFDMTKLSIEKADPLTRSISIIFDDKSYFPVEISVHFDSITEVDNIAPSEITSQEATAAGKLAAIATGTAGTLLGTKIGSLVSGKDIFMKLTGSALGGIAGGAAGAGSGYLVTKNFLTGMALPGSTLGQKEEMIDSAKALIALELMTSADTLNTALQMAENMAASSAKDAVNFWGNNTRAYYRNELSYVLIDFFKRFGWENITVVFTGGGKLLVDDSQNNPLSLESDSSTKSFVLNLDDSENFNTKVSK